MSQIHPDDQAFPLPETEWHSSSYGLSVRDYIAIKFAAAILSNSKMDPSADAAKMVAHAYQLADVLIAERNK
jgi:hypothetical protein